MEQGMNKGKLRYEPLLMAKMLGLPEDVQIDDVQVCDGVIEVYVSNEGDMTPVTVPWIEGAEVQEQVYDLKTYVSNVSPFIEEIEERMSN